MNTPYNYWVARDAALAVEFRNVAMSNVEVAAVIGFFTALITVTAFLLN